MFLIQRERLPSSGISASPFHDVFISAPLLIAISAVDGRVKHAYNMIEPQNATT